MIILSVRLHWNKEYKYFAIPPFAFSLFFTWMTSKTMLLFMSDELFSNLLDRKQETMNERKSSYSQVHFANAHIFQGGIRSKPESR